MRNQYKAVIWDMGGVLLHEVDKTPRKNLAHKYQLNLQELNRLVFNSESAKRATTGEISSEDHWTEIGRMLDIPENELVDFQRIFWSGDRIDETLVAFIDELRDTYLIGLLSNAWSDVRQTISGKFDILDHFHQSVFSAEVGMAKPDPAIYWKTLDLLGVEPVEAIFVDDLQENIDTANRLGITGVQFITAEQAISEVRKYLFG